MVCNFDFKAININYPKYQKVRLISARENSFRQDYFKICSAVFGGSNFRNVRSKTHYPTL